MQKGSGYATTKNTHGHDNVTWYFPFGSAEVSTTSLESVDGPSNISFQDLDPAAGALEGWTGTLRNGDKACSLIGSSPARHHQDRASSF